MVHLAGGLVAELTTDEAGVAALLVVVHLLAEAQRAARQGVSVEVAQPFNGAGHILPAVALLEQLLVHAGAVVKVNAAVQHRGVGDVLVHLLGREFHAAFAFGGKERHGALVYRVVHAQPVGKHDFVLVWV